MKITRTIKFKSFGSDCYHLPTSQQIEDTRFDANFCKYLVEKIPETGSCRGKTDEEKIDNFLSDGDSKKSDRAVDAAFNFLFTKGYITTHYISAIHLGACKYTRSSTNKTVTSGGGSIDALVLDSGVSVGGKASTTKISSTSSEVSKGDVDAVAIGQDEHLIEYELTPVSELLSLKRVKDVIKEAIVLHMERGSKLTKTTAPNLVIMHGFSRGNWTHRQLRPRLGSIVECTLRLGMNLVINFRT